MGYIGGNSRRIESDLAMKILFATPPVSREACYGDLKDAGSAAPALGLLMLAAVARDLGHEVTVLDGVAMQLDAASFRAHLNAFAPDVLGLSATTFTVAAAAAVAQAAKSARPGVVTILGGPHVSAVPDETMRRFPAFDVAVIGEGEATLAELLAVLDRRGDLVEVAGLLIRNGERLLSTGPRVPIAGLDTLPLPAWELLDGFPRRYAPAPFKVRQLPAASLVSSRGCPNRCLFCDRSVFGDHCRFHSADSVVAMIRTLAERFGVREICFEDDTFVTHRGRLKAICEQLIALDAGITWNCLARVNQVTAEGLVLMRRAGCWQVSFGIESGSQRILELIGKQATLAQIREAVRMTRAAGLRAKGFFILGHPGETRETLRETIDFALQLPLNDISVSLMTPFPGTELHRRAAEFGTLNPDWERMNLLTAAFLPHGLAGEDLQAAQRALLRRFYLRPRAFVDYAGRLLRQPSLAGPLLRGGLALVKAVRHG